MSGAPFTFRAWSLLITLVEGGEMVVVDNFCCVTIKLETPPPPRNPSTLLLSRRKIVTGVLSSSYNDAE